MISWLITVRTYIDNKVLTHTESPSRFWLIFMCLMTRSSVLYKQIAMSLGHIRTTLCPYSKNLLQTKRIHRFRWAASSLRSHSQQIRSDFPAFQSNRCCVSIHRTNKPIKFRQLPITDWRRKTNRSLFATACRRYASTMHWYFTHLATIPLMYQTFEKFWTVHTDTWRLKCRYLKLVVGVSAAHWFQSFPVNVGCVSYMKETFSNWNSFDLHCLL